MTPQHHGTLNLACSHTNNNLLLNVTNLVSIINGICASSLSLYSLLACINLELQSKSYLSFGFQTSVTMNERFSDSTTSSTFKVVGETLNISSSV